jgi:bifunctional non-homologous end joining protein LigD
MANTTSAVSAHARSRRSGAKRANPSRGAASDVLALVEQLAVGFPLTHLDKLLYPENGVRKAELVAYYAAIADWMLPHVERRPLVLLRCPEGRRKGCFFQKHMNEGVPDAVGRVTIRESKGEGVYGFVKDLNGLIALAQLGVLEIHNWGCHVQKLEKPDLFVFDLDPDEGLGFERVIEAALTLREQLAALGLESFVKTTGGKGLHVVVPVRPKHSWDEHKAFAHALVTAMMRAEPERYVTNMRKEARKGKIFLDYLRNARGASAVAPYSPRAREGALIATPLRWSELEAGARPEQFDLRGVIRRLEDDPRDPWRGFFTLSQSLPGRALQKLELA